MTLGKIKTALILSVATMLVSSPAIAADAVEGKDAANEGNSRVGEGEIIVTARRQEERLQDVPLSVVVMSPDQLINNNVRSVMDLATIAPSLTVNTLFGADNAKFSIRGFSQASRTAAAVGVYFDEVVAPRAGNGSTSAGDGAGQGEMFDLQNVQVLNGPQGTLFGRNTTGGSVLIVSKKPTDRLEG
jgi:iron complex outermembrane receptor protein